MLQPNGFHSREGMELFKYRNAVSIAPLGRIDDLASISYCGPQSVIMNAVINAKINMKRLEFNQKKCVKLHISKEKRKVCSENDPDSRNVNCAFLQVQDCQMKDGDEERYIGDVISCNGSNDSNISRRRSIGTGAVSQIFTLHNEVSLGYQYVEIGLILRETILLSKMILSSESWHKVFLYQIEKLEEIYTSFFRQLFNCHSKTGIEFYYSESASIPIRIKISARRLMYWWHLVRVDRSELINRVYSAQKLSPVSGDWTNLLKLDKAEFDITLSDSEVAKISEQKFKNFVKKKSV